MKNILYYVFIILTIGLVTYGAEERSLLHILLGFLSLFACYFTSEIEKFPVITEIQPCTKRFYERTRNWRGDLVENNETKCYFIEYTKKIYFLWVLPLKTYRFAVRFPHRECLNYILTKIKTGDDSDILTETKTYVVSNALEVKLPMKIELRSIDTISQHRNWCEDGIFFDSESEVLLTINAMKQYPNMFIF